MKQKRLFSTDAWKGEVEENQITPDTTTLVIGKTSEGIETSTGREEGGKG